MTILGLILDFVLIGLLGTMIYFAVRLHKRLEVLRTGKQDLEILLRDLVLNTATAERNLKELQVVAEELAPSLQKQVTGARAAREELEFLLAAADSAAERLMNQIGASKAETKSEFMASTQSVGHRPSQIQSQAQPQPAAPVLAPALQAIPAVARVKAPEDERRLAETDLLRAIEKLR